ncbi:MAG TPA: hypothetical protein VLA06_03730 [Woeseiaceae bacterium]|jgi:hypothetical protein|nr:hypothetical protein [Woeseiaceae bacterium]
MTTEHSDNHDRELLELLRELPAPEAPPGFYDRALARVAHRGSRRQRNRWLATGFAAALAATAAFWVVAGLLLDKPELPHDDAIPGVTLALEQPRTVNFVFASATALDSAMLTISLPDGIELQGFPGRRQITWETSLREGKNLLPLTLVALSPAGGELLATLEHDARDRSFRLRVMIAEEPPDGTPG